MTCIAQQGNTLVSKCSKWRVKWGQGSSRPDHYTLYMGDDEHDQYMGTYLTLRAAMEEALELCGGRIDWNNPTISGGFFRRRRAKRQHSQRRRLWTYHKRIFRTPLKPRCKKRVIIE